MRARPVKGRARSAWEMKPLSFSASRSPSWAVATSSSARAAFPSSSSRAESASKASFAANGSRSRCSRSFRASPLRDVRWPHARAASRGIPRSRASSSTSSPRVSLSPSHSSQAWAKSTSASAASAMRKPGTTPQSRGLSWRMAAHRAWIVETLARSRTSRASEARSRSSVGRAESTRTASSRSLSRSFIVVAAFSVNVTAAIWVRDAEPERTIASIRSTRSVVFPVPAPASTTRLVPWSRRALSRASSSTGRKLIRDSSAGGRTGVWRHGS